MIYEKAYAKINLALEVMEEENGYHRVNNLMIPISIYDELTFKKADEITIIPDTIKDNLCVRAAKLFLEKYHISSGVCITLNKNIPIAAGLAGGSSDAAATLRGLNRLFGTRASEEELEALAKKIGSDVPFFIKTQPAMCTHYGERITPLNFPIFRFKLLLLKINIGLSTKMVYQKYTYLKKDRSKNIEEIYRALKIKDISLLKENIFNDLTQPALCLSDELEKLYSKIKGMGISVFLSGSGPTLFLIEPTKEEIDKIKKEIPKETYFSLCEILL